MSGHGGPRGTPPVIMMDPLGQFWTAWLKGVELGMAWTMLWAGATSAAARPGGVRFTVNLPYANGFSQTIDPSTNWGWIDRQATDAPEVETAVVRDVASYGTQIARLMALTLDLAERAPEVDRKTLDAVRALAAEIEAIKAKRGG